MSKLWRLLLGRTLATSEGAERKIGVLAGIPALGLDGLSSSAYGPEAALTILLPLGAVGLLYIGPLILVILALLAILYFSYRQTIAAYPGGGGSYTVARENLGVGASLLAAAALMIDYVLTVAVGISAGVAALISAFPVLQPYTLPLCLSALLLVTFVNLRGTSEAGWAFALPTYLFVGCLGLVLVVGGFRALLSGGHPVPAVALPALPAPTGAVTLWLLLRSFASGCTAMTGVEAVSNGVNAFAAPAVARAKQTLTAIVVILAVLLGGIAWLCQAYGVGAMDQTDPGYQSVLSQLTAAVFGNGPLYYVTMAGVLAVLVLSANTSFVDFPRLCRLIARDDFLPRPFALVGRRLVYSVGIWFLTVTAALLLIGFGGITDRLIPLYAVGAFLAFTLSQAGMVMHWRKVWARPPEAGQPAPGRAKLLFGMTINGIGAAATGGALAVILAAKFLEGAWITLLAIPTLVLLFLTVKQHYLGLEHLTRTCGPLNFSNNHPPIVVMATHRWNRLTRKALRFALRLSPDVIALHLSDLEGEQADEHALALRKQWAHEVEGPARQAGLPAPRLHVIHARYRNLIRPVRRFVEELEKEHPNRQVAVIIPELVITRWWHYFLHNHRAAGLRRALLALGHPRIAVITLPWRMHHLHDEDHHPDATPPAT
jgi:amino acid transporter